MQRESDEAPSLSTREPIDAEAVSLRDIEMILAPGIAPPPLPSLRTRELRARQADPAAMVPRPVVPRPGAKAEPPAPDPAAVRALEPVAAPSPEVAEPSPEVAAPPPEPAAASTAASEETAAGADGAPAGAEGSTSRQEAAPVLRRRREKPVAATAPDQAFQDFRATSADAKKAARVAAKPRPKGGEDPEAREHEGTTARVGPPPLPPEAPPPLPDALPPPLPSEPPIDAGPALDALEDEPTSGLLDVRHMISALEEPVVTFEGSDVDPADELFQLTGGLLPAEATTPLLAPPEPVDLGPRADDAILQVFPEAPAQPLLAPSMQALAEPASPEEPAADEAASASARPGASSRRAFVERPAKAPAAAGAAAAKSAPKASPAVVAQPAPAPPRQRAPWIIAVAAVGVAAWFALVRGPNGGSPQPPAAPKTVVQQAMPAEVVERRAVEAPAAAAPEQGAAALSPKPADAPVAETAAAPAKPEVAAKPDVAAKPEVAKAASEPARAAEPVAKAEPAAAKAAPPAAKEPPAAATPPPAAPAPTPAPAGGAAFNKDAASAALNAAAGQAASCKAEDDPSGVARVSVTFAPSGRVTSATVQGAPFAGTKTGGCIAMTFRKASVPPFDGDPVAVSKSFTVR